MVTAAFGDDTVNMLTIGRNQAADIIGGEKEEALETILLLGLKSNTALAFEEGAGSPGSAPEDTGGVGGGGHGVEILVELGRVDLLGFVDGEEQVGSGTNDFSRGVAGKELDTSSAKRVHVTLGGMPATARADTFVERSTDTFHVIGGLWFEGGGNGDNFPARVGITEEEPGKEVSLEFILAGLTWEDDDKGEAKMAKDGFLDGKNDPALVGTEVDAARPGPADGIMTDGFANAKGKRRLVKSVHHQGHQRKTESRRQEAVGRRQRAKSRRQKAEGGRQKKENKKRG
jgi:hypothetical protein